MPGHGAVRPVDEGRETSTHWSRLDARLRALTPRRRVLYLALTALAVYGGLIALDGLVLRSVLDSSFGTTPDLAIYQERAGLLLNGGMIYRDIYVESPPLINYLFIPPQLAGGEWWSYEIYFSLFSFLTALSLYLVLRQWDDHLAFLGALMFLVCPFMVEDATLGIQDEPLVGFFFIVPVLLFLRGRPKGASLGVAIGFWTKFLSIILFPAMLLQLPTWRERLRHIGIVALASLTIAVPFLLICPIEFLLFPSYYLLGEADGGAGMSAIGLLTKAGIVLPGEAGAVLTVLALAVAYGYAWRRGMDVWRTCLLVTVVFLSIYPMIRLGYFLIPFAFLVVWAAEDRRIAARLFAMYLPLLFAQGLEAMISDGLDPSFAWLALALLIVGLAIMADTTRIALRRRCFLDRPPGGATPLWGLEVPGSAPKVSSSQKVS